VHFTWKSTSTCTYSTSRRYYPLSECIWMVLLPTRETHNLHVYMYFRASASTSVHVHLSASLRILPASVHVSVPPMLSVTVVVIDFHLNKVGQNYTVYMFFTLLTTCFQ
jgi:hypothetical protein